MQVNVGFYAHALKAAFGLAEKSIPSFLLCDPKCIAATTYFGIFGIVIALMKDVPDIKGDELNNIRSFSVRTGAPKIFKVKEKYVYCYYYYHYYYG